MAVNVATLGSWLNYGVDFTGGTMIHLDFAQPVSARRGSRHQLRAGRSRASESRRRASISSECPPSRNDWTSTRRPSALRGPHTRFGEGSFRWSNGGRERPGRRRAAARALLAILISFVATLIYLAFRFEWRFGVAAIIATAHDILITLGLIAALQDGDLDRDDRRLPDDRRVLAERHDRGVRSRPGESRKRMRGRRTSTSSIGRSTRRSRERSSPRLDDNRHL
jgi:hypothetical protein